MQLIRHVNVVSACKQRMHLWGLVPPRASRCSAAHTNTTRTRIDKHTHAHTTLHIHITVFVSAMASTRAPCMTCCCAFALAVYEEVSLSLCFSKLHLILCCPSPYCIPHAIIESRMTILINYFRCLAARFFPREACSIRPLAPLFAYLRIW